MKRLLLCSFVVLLVCSSAFAAAKPAVGKLQGAYNITFYMDPTFTGIITYCVVFTNTGQVSGFPNSGTFSAPSNPLWKGTWWVIGDEVMIDTVVNSSEIIPLYGSRLAINKLGGRWTDFQPDGSSAGGGTFFGTFLPNGCPSTPPPASFKLGQK